MGGRVFIGRVVSNRMQRTAVVAVSYAVWVPKYKVYQKRVSRHQAHDEQQACVVGDIVRIQATRKMSKHKSYAVTDVVRKANVFNKDDASRIVWARDKQPTPTAVEAAKRNVQETAARLQALRDMYAKELGQGVSLSGITPQP